MGKSTEAGDQLLNNEEYESRLHDLVNAFKESLLVYKKEWLDVPCPEEEGIVPIAGILLIGSYGDQTATRKSDVDMNVFVDGESVGPRLVDAIAEKFVKDLTVNAEPKKLKIDNITIGINFKDLEEVKYILGDYASEKRGVVIIYNAESDLKDIVEPILNELNITNRFIAILA
jgi:hypothetical protein